MQLYFTAGICCLHGKLTAVWNFWTLSFTLPEVIWTLIMKPPYTEVKLYPEVKSQTGLSSLPISCKRALNLMSLSNSIPPRTITVYMENSQQFEMSLRSFWPKWNSTWKETHFTPSHALPKNWQGTELISETEVTFQTGSYLLQVEWPLFTGYFVQIKQSIQLYTTKRSW